MSDVADARVALQRLVNERARLKSRLDELYLGYERLMSAGGARSNVSDAAIQNMINEGRDLEKKLLVVHQKGQELLAILNRHN